MLSFSPFYQGKTMTVKIATWNVNSLRVRLPQVLQWVDANQPDLLAIQETKLLDIDTMLDDIQQLGYDIVHNGQKTYNGVAIISKRAMTDVMMNLPDFEDHQRRVLGVSIGDTRIINLYVPNGERIDSEKYHYKLNWLQKLHEFLAKELLKYPHLIILGDFNIAPSDQDVFDPSACAGQVLVSEPERDALDKVMRLGLTDCFRLHSPSEKSFTWWDYRMNSFKRNRGLRIDHIFASHHLHCERCYIDSAPRGAERPSDHAPVVAEFTRFAGLDLDS